MLRKKLKLKYYEKNYSICNRLKKSHFSSKRESNILRSNHLGIKEIFFPFGEENGILVFNEQGQNNDKRDRERESRKAPTTLVVKYKKLSQLTV